MNTNEELVKITDCVEYFAKRGREVHRTTISRFVDKHGLERGRRGKAVMVNASEVFKAFTADMDRSIRSGEASGARPARTGGDASPPAKSAGSERHSPRQKRVPFVAPDGDEADSMDGAKPRMLSAAEQEKVQKVRALKRENDVAEGRLVPTVEVAAAMAAAIAEMRATFKRRMREFVEKAAAQFELDTSQSIEFKAELQAFLATGQNVFAAEMRKLLEDRAEDASQAARDLNDLIELALEQTAARHGDEFDIAAA